MDVFQEAGCGVYGAPLVNAAQRFGITDDGDVARWLAQLSVESGGFTRSVESLNYSAARLLAVFPGRNGMMTLDDAENIVGQGTVAIGNAIYGGSWGAVHLGNTQPGDGYRYRGRGLIQLTGRDNYARASQAMPGLLDNPDLLSTPQGAADCAAWYWCSKQLNGVTDVVAITKAINGGLNALAEREAMTAKLLG